MIRSNTNIVSFSVLSVCCHCIAFVLLPKHLLVAGGTTTATTTNVGSSVSVVPIDLSYLHGCGVDDLASVIRGRLEEEQSKKQQQQQSLFLSSTQDYTTNFETETESETEIVLLDIDLTASLIGKNVSEILDSLKEQQQQQQQQQQRSSKEDPSDGATTSARSIPINLTARRNRLSPREATAVLEFVLENGPTNETRTITTIATATATAINENDKVTSTASSGEEETAPSEETIATEVSEESQAENNATAVDASSTITDTNTNITTNTSTTTPSTESDSQNGETKDDVDGIGSEREATTEETPIATTTTTTTTTFVRPAFVSIQSLDLGWNNLGISASATTPSSARSNAQIRALNTALRRLLADREQCPPCIKLNVCGLGPQACRDLAKGIVDRYNSNKNQLPIPPLFLDLACNEGIGDVGAAALAAAIRTVAPSPRDGFDDDKRKTKKRKKRRKSRSEQQFTTLTPEKEENETKSNEHSNEENSTTASVESGPPEESSRTVLERLDLSGCGIGDAGAEALAIALANNPLCIKHLDLSNNRISDQGAAALAKALLGGLIETLDLSHNKDLGDAGAKQLAIAFQEDRISKLVLRSCNIRADGAACFGRALRVLGAQVPVPGEQALSSSQPRGIDLSGNPLGILGKKKKASNKYSATALRSKATDTTKAYMNIIGKSLQKGLNSINAATNGDGMDALESDDEEEGRMGELEEEDESRKKCGALSLAEAFIEDGFEDGTTKSGDTADKEREGSSLRVELGLRHCSFDTRAAEALAAVLHESKENFPRMKLSMDTRMNHVLEDDVVAALHNGNDDGNDDGDDDQLVADMAEVYLDALEVMKEARERALQASRMAASRAKAAAVREAAWGAPPPGRRQYHNYEEEWGDEENEDDEEWDDPTSIADDDYDRNFEEDYSDEEW